MRLVNSPGLYLVYPGSATCPCGSSLAGRIVIVDPI